MMKRIPAILILSLLTACSTYEVKDAGDGVYYAESPPEYRYVYSSGWPFWHSAYYYPVYSSCWYAPYISRSCYWWGTPNFYYSVFSPIYFDQFAIRYMKTAGESGEHPVTNKHVVLPAVPGNPGAPSMAEARTLKYGTARSYQGAKAVPGKSSYPSTTSAFGKRTMTAPKQSYSRPTRSRSSSRPRVSIKSTAPRKLD